MATSGECLRGKVSGVVDWSGGVFASCITRVQLYVNACNWMAAVCAAAPLALVKSTATSEIVKCSGPVIA